MPRVIHFEIPADDPERAVKPAKFSILWRSQSKIVTHQNRRF